VELIINLQTAKALSLTWRPQCALLRYEQGFGTVIEQACDEFLM
jgi:hypothetical protein